MNLYYLCLLQFDIGENFDESCYYSCQESRVIKIGNEGNHRINENILYLA